MRFSRLRQLREQFRAERRIHGWKGVIRRRGWRFAAVVIGIYLVRDVLLYVVVPGIVYAGIGR